METQLFTVNEASTRLRVCPATVYALCAAKKLRHQRVGVGRGKILISLEAIAEYLAKGMVAPTERPVWSAR